MLLAFAVYGNSISNRFVFDDIPLIVENPAIKTPLNIPGIIGLGKGKPLYRPVRYLSYVFDYSISGLDTEAYHVSNICYHALTSFILFCLLKILCGSVPAALAGALLFLVHPVQTDSVAYISGRRDILTTLFYLSGFYSFVLFRKEGKKYLLFLTAIMYFLAIASKEMAVTLPAICLLYDFTFSREKFKEIFCRSLKLYTALSVMAVFFLYYKLVLHYPSLRTQYYGGGITANFATVFRIIFRYIQLVFFPVVLTADYSFNAFHVSKSFFEGDVIRALFVDLLAFFAVLRSFKISRLVFFGGIWFFITLLPVCQIFPHHEIMAEHYLYLPMAGFIMLVCPVFLQIFNWNRTVSVALLVVLVAVLSFRTVVRNTDWRDSMTLWSKVIELTPQCARAHDNLGTVYLKRRDFKKAMYHYRQAVKIRPAHGIFHNNLGMVLGMTGDIEEAEKEFRKALSLNRRLAAAYNNLGIIYFNKDRYKVAAGLFYESARIKPSAKAWFNCGMSKFKTGHTRKALMFIKKAIRYNKEYAEAYRWMGSMQDSLGHEQEALEALGKAVVLKPDYAEAYWLMAGIYEKKGDMNRALWYLERVLKTATDPGLKSKIKKKIEVLNSSQANGYQ